MRHICMVILVCLSSGLFAQEFKGIVYELGSDAPLQGVAIQNVSNQETIKSSELGYFSIPASISDLIIFAYPGYRKDTLVVTALSLKRVYLTPVDAPNLLKEVEITALSDAALEKAIADAETKAKAGGATGTGVWISPSRLLGKEAKETRRLHDVLVHEQNTRAIFARFTAERIQELTPLSGRDLDLFMIKYKPSYTFITGADEQALNVYIMDAYASFKKLTREEKEHLKLRE